MTQIKEGLIKSAPKPMLIRMVEDSTSSRDLKPSEELLKKIAEVKDSLTTAGKMIKEAYDLAIRDGFNPQQARQFLTAQLPFLAERTIRLALPDEAKDQSKVRHTLPQNPLPKTINISSEHKVIDVEPVGEKELEYMDKIPEQSYDPEQEIKKIGEIRRAEQKRQAEEPIVPDDEDPKDLEIQFLKEQNEELKDALHKTQQFRPANQLTETQARDMTMQVVKQAGLAVPETNIDSVLDWVKKQADGVHSFYYDAYGIDLFKNRELSQLKNSGVKVFRRLYFEV